MKQLTIVLNIPDNSNINFQLGSLFGDGTVIAVANYDAIAVNDILEHACEQGDKDLCTVAMEEVNDIQNGVRMA